MIKNIFLKIILFNLILSFLFFYLDFHILSVYPFVIFLFGVLAGIFFINKKYTNLSYILFFTPVNYGLFYTFFVFIFGDAIKEFSVSFPEDFLRFILIILMFIISFAFYYALGFFIIYLFKLKFFQRSKK